MGQSHALPITCGRNGKDQVGLLSWVAGTCVARNRLVWYNPARQAELDSERLQPAGLEIVFDAPDQA